MEQTPPHIRAQQVRFAKGATHWRFSWQDYIRLTFKNYINKIVTYLDSFIMQLSQTIGTLLSGARRGKVLEPPPKIRAVKSAFIVVFET